MFDADAVVADGDRHRERDGRLVMADGNITVVEGTNTAIATFPIDRITGVSYSTARHPLWNSPTGPAEVLRVEGGTFGIRRGARNWLVFHTTDSVHVVRVSDEDIRSVIAALQARIGQPVRRVAEKRTDADVLILTFLDAGLPRVHRLRDGDNLIGRAPVCELVITARKCRGNTRACASRGRK